MANTYDFYKPQLSSEYPEVDGPVSVVTYIAALDAAYSRFREKVAKASKHAQLNGSAAGEKASDVFSLEDVDYSIFHSPYGKQAVKGFARIMYNDFLSAPTAPHFVNIPNPEAFLSQTHVASLSDKNVEKTFITASKAAFTEKVDPSMACSRRLGNMYTASLYGCLASLLSTVEPATLKGKRVGLFAFGSGCAASYFTLRVTGDTTEIRDKMDLVNRLSNMKVVPCQEFVEALAVCSRPFSRLYTRLTCDFPIQLREKNHNAASYTPEGSVDNIWPGAYYLESVDSKYRRKYLRAPLA
jgi:hydroxymethylglutaryl-CoA synthase